MISPETIALVRDRTDILAVISEAVPSLKRRGRSWVGLCPFHKEKTPSFHVNPDRGFFHCFGCKESGSAIDFLIKNEGYTFPEAVRSLAERAGIPIEETSSNQAFTEADRQRKAKDDLYAVNALAATFFEEQMRRHEHRAYALDELDRRGLMPGRDATVDEVLQAFRIGYAPPQWDGLTSFLRAQGVSPVAAETVGLLVPRSSGSGYYDRFRHRLMFAVVDAQGRVVAFSGRALHDLPGTEKPDPDKGGPPPKYINSPESPVYTKGNMLFGIHQARHAIRSEEEAILVEGNFDVVSLHARGIQNVVAPLGTAFTVEQAKLVKRFASNIVFLFDGDAAGRKAVRLSREAVKAAGVSARVADLPEGVDPDELSKSKGAQAVRDLVGSAKGMLEALIDAALDEAFSSADARERQNRVAFIVKLIADEDDPVVRAMAKSYADQLAGRLDIVQSGAGAFAALEQNVKQAFAKLAAAERANRGPAPSRISALAAGVAERRNIVGALIEWPVLLDDDEIGAALSHLEGPSVVHVAALRSAWNSDLKTLDTESFLKQIPESVAPFVARHLADPTLESEAEAKEYLLRNANQLKRLLLSQDAAQNKRETYRARGDWDAERELLEQSLNSLREKHGVKK